MENQGFLCDNVVMTGENKSSSTQPITLAEAMRLQEIESNPLSAQDLARHERFNADGLSVKQRIEALKSEIGNPVIAAE